MHKLVLFVFGLLLILVEINCISITYKDVFLEEWENFKLTFGKIYKDKETENFRLKVFMENKLKIAKHNQLASKGIKNYHLNMNGFGDVLHHEFVRMVNGYQLSAKFRNGSTFLVPHNFTIPKEVDWRDQGYVTPVKDQKQCGSCWAFSTTGSLEGQHYRKTGQLVSLSEQNLVDCSTSFGNNGCNGGLMDNAFTYIKSNGGIDTEESYPYEAKDDDCRFKKTDVGADDTGFVDVPSGDELKLAAAVASVGPVSVAIDASHESFQFYSHGVYDEPECSSTQLDHGVLVVGYGESGSIFNKKKYWIIKNSWGERWGQKGYINIAREENNRCGVATQASYPLV